MSNPTDAPPLCPVHARIDKNGALEMTIGGNNCVACSLNERQQLLDLLAPFAPDNASEDSLTVLRRLTEFYNTHTGDNRVVVSYPASSAPAGQGGDLARAIADAEFGRKTHQQWLDYLEHPHRDTNDGVVIEDVGSVEHQREWITRYDNILACLRAGQGEAADFTRRVLNLFSDHDIHSLLFWKSDGYFGMNVNDVFFWGAADLEQVTPENIDELERAIQDCIAIDDCAETEGCLLFAARQRNARPQGAAYPENRALWPLFDAAGPERETGFGNPYKPGDYKHRATPSPISAPEADTRIVFEHGKTGPCSACGNGDTAQRYHKHGEAPAVAEHGEAHWNAAISVVKTIATETKDEYLVRQRIIAALESARDGQRSIPAKPDDCRPGDEWSMRR